MKFIYLALFLYAKEWWLHQLQSAEFTGTSGATGFGAGMAKSKNHTTHNIPQNGKEIGSRNPDHEDMNL